jgi:B-box zinc finger
MMQVPRSPAPGGNRRSSGGAMRVRLDENEGSLPLSGANTASNSSSAPPDMCYKSPMKRARRESSLGGKPMRVLTPRKEGSSRLERGDRSPALSQLQLSLATAAAAAADTQRNDACETMCEECEASTATLHCAQCEQALCAGCSAALHRKAARARHTVAALEQKQQQQAMPPPPPQFSLTANTASATISSATAAIATITTTTAAAATATAVVAVRPQQQRLSSGSTGSSSSSSTASSRAGEEEAKCRKWVKDDFEVYNYIILSRTILYYFKLALSRTIRS